MIVKNVEVFYLKGNKPNSRYNKKNPTWEVEIRTRKKSVKDNWLALGLNVKNKIIEDEETGDILDRFWRVKFYKKSKTSEGADATPPTIVDGSLNEIDPDTVGNGSIGNVRLFERSYLDEADGKTKKAFTFMGLQVTTLMYYEQAKREDFEEVGETEIIHEDSQDESEDEFKKQPVKTSVKKHSEHEADEEFQRPAPKRTVSKKAPSKKDVEFDDDDIPFDGGAGDADADGEDFPEPVSRKAAPKPPVKKRTEPRRDVEDEDGF